MPRSPRPVSRDEALKAAAEAVVILTGLRNRSRRPDSVLDEQIAALTQAGVVIARTPDHTEN